MPWYRGLSTCFIVFGTSIIYRLSLLREVRIPQSCETNVRRTGLFTTQKELIKEGGGEALLRGLSYRGRQV